MIKNIPFSPPDITQAEIDEVVDALKSGWITTGPKTKELERRVAKRCNTNKADYYKTTDFSKVEGVTRFTSEEINSMLEQSKDFLTNIQTVKIPNDCHGVFFVQDSMKHIDELSPLAKHNLKKVVNRNAYLPDSDKIELSKEIENTNKDQSQELDKDVPEKNEVTVKMFQFAKSINRLLSGNQPQKKRNLDKLIKQTKPKENQSLQRNIPLR